MCYFRLMEGFLLGRIGVSTVTSGTWNVLPKSRQGALVRGGICLAQVRAGLGVGRCDWWGKEDEERTYLGLCKWQLWWCPAKESVVFPPASLFQDTLSSKVPRGSQGQNVLTVWEGFFPLFDRQTSFLNVFLLILKQVLRREKPREPGIWYLHDFRSFSSREQ